MEHHRQFWPGELCFPEEEFAFRLAKIQTEVKKEHLSGALIFDPENIFWLTGYQTIGYFTFQAMYVPANGKPTLITRIVNRDLALALSTIADVVVYSDIQDPIAVLANFIRIQTVTVIGLETQSQYFSVANNKKLESLIKVDTLEFNNIIEHYRITKSSYELDRIQEAARAAVAGIDAALREIAIGKSENDIAAALIAGSTRAGSEYFGHPPMVVAGARSELCFALWRRNTLCRGDVVLLEGAGVIDRYHAMMSRSAILGPPSDEHKATADALIEVLETAVDTIKPGITSGEIDRICRSKLEAKSLGNFFKSRMAYGIGIGFPPNWSEGHIYSIRPDDDLVVQANMTFHVIPTMFRKGFGMAISDSIRVTGSGCEMLTHYPRDLVVVD